MIEEPFLIEHPTYEDHRGISFWIDKHNRNSDREAYLYLKQSASGSFMAEASLDFKKQVKLFVRHNVWDRLPLLLRPFLYFIYRYFVKLGFLDGKAGFIFCFLHALWYQSLIDIKITERRI
jgi:hypothetical protein